MHTEVLSGLFVLRV